MAHENKYWNTVEVLQKDEKRASIIEELKLPYVLAMENDWEGMKKYYELNPHELKSQMTLEGDTALHIAASRCSKKLGERVLESLISLLPSYDEKCEALRNQNSHGNHVLHEVAVSGNLKAAEFLVSKFNKPPAHVPSEETSSNDDKSRHLLEIRNKLGESPIYRAAALGHTDLVQFFADKLKEENPDNLLRHFHRNDKMSILHIAVIAQHFETAHWLQKNYKFLAQRKDGKGLTSLQLVAQMPTALDPVFQQSKWKMLIYHCLPVGDLVTPNHKDNDVVKDDVESRLGSESDQPPQSIHPKKLAVILNVYTSMWNFLTKENSIIDKIWKDRKNKNYLKELIRLLVKEDYSWQDSKTAEDKTISLWSEENHNNNNGECDGGDQEGKGSAEPTKPMGQILLLVEKLIPLLAEKGYSCQNTKQAKDETTVVPVEHGRYKKGNGPAGPTKSKKQKVYTYTPLLIATITGFVPVVKEILEQHPQAAEHGMKKVKVPPQNQLAMGE